MMRLPLLIGAVLALCLASPQAYASNCAVDEYDHNGSRMEVQMCDDGLFITYVEPRRGIRGSGVAKGTLLFDGAQQRNGTVSGLARVFNKACGEATYSVSGSIRGGTIELRGDAPVRDSRCRATSYRADRLVFTLLGAAPAGPPRVGPRPTATVAPAACGWYAVGGCFTSESDANRRSIQIDGYTLDTYEVSNFTDGWYCSVDGPYGSQADADLVSGQFRGMGVSDAYVKKGGC